MGAAIRLATPHDAAAILAIYAPIVLHTAISFEMVPPALTDMQQRITDTLTTWPWLVCERAGEILGYAYASRHRARAAYQWSVDTSVYVHAGVHRAGVGRALYTSLVALLRLQHFFNAYAGITLPNPASAALHESVGFQALGVYHAVGYKLGAWHDVGWWQLALQPHTDSPQAPTALPIAQDTPAWPAALAQGLGCLRL